MLCAGFGDEAEHARTDRGQAQAARMAGPLDRRRERSTVMDVMLGIDAGVATHGWMMVARPP